MSKDTCKHRLDPGQIEVVDDEMAAVLRAKKPHERIAMMGECNETMRALIAAHLRERHPDWSPEQVQAEVARRMLGDSD